MILPKLAFEEDSSLFSDRDTFVSESSTNFKDEVKTFIEKFEKKEKDNFISQFKHLIDESDFEYGFSSPAEEYVKESLKKFGPFAREWINEIFIKNFDNEHIISSILKILMHLDYGALEPQGITMLLAALTHKSATVREDVIRTFENWENPEYISILKNLKCEEPRLQTMLDEVIEYLESL